MEKYKELWDDPYKEFWTIEELADALGKSCNSLKAHFKQQQQYLKEHGIIITKYGRGQNARYTLDYGYDEEEY